VAAELGLSFERQTRVRGLGPVKARIARGATPAGPFLLVKPWTYMNLSGEAVAAYARFYRILPESIFVISDDLNLPLGRIRIRPGGSPGGHNGLKSLLAGLGSEGFPRLRMGIAIPELPPAVMADPDFVLSRFSGEERAALAPVLEDAAAAVRGWLDGVGLDVLMNRYNPGSWPSGSE
jgi:PTH1 family peptidyl-tRNA hydrolase